MPVLANARVIARRTRTRTLCTANCTASERRSERHCAITSTKTCAESLGGVEAPNAGDAVDAEAVREADDCVIWRIEGVRAADENDAEIAGERRGRKSAKL